MTTTTTSVGHVRFYENANGATYEIYRVASGDYHHAPVDNVIDLDTGHRIGRYLVPSHMSPESYLGLDRSFGDECPSCRRLRCTTPNECEARFFAAPAPRLVDHYDGTDNPFTFDRR